VYPPLDIGVSILLNPSPSLALDLMEKVGLGFINTGVECLASGKLWNEFYELVEIN